MADIFQNSYLAISPANRKTGMEALFSEHAPGENGVLELTGSGPDGARYDVCLRETLDRLTYEVNARYKEIIFSRNTTIPCD
jgi:hypothetical protein